MNNVDTKNKCKQLMKNIKPPNSDLIVVGGTICDYGDNYSLNIVNVVTITIFNTLCVSVCLSLCVCMCEVETKSGIWVSFCPSQVGLTWFINYSGMTRILHWTTSFHNGVWS